MHATEYYYSKNIIVNFNAVSARAVRSLLCNPLPFIIYVHVFVIPVFDLFL